MDAELDRERLDLYLPPPPGGPRNDLDRDEQENRKGFVLICSVCHKPISELLQLISVVGISSK